MVPLENLNSSRAITVQKDSVRLHDTHLDAYLQAGVLLEEMLSSRCETTRGLKSGTVIVQGGGR